MKNIFAGLKGKGFIAAVCVCLLIAGGAGIYSYNKVADKLNDDLVQQNKNTSDTADKSAEQAASPKTDVQKPAETTAAETVTEKAEDAEVPVSDIAIAEEAAAQPLVRPLNGEVLSEFSNGELVKSATLNVWKTHDGVDISGEPGEKVKSMTGGTVTKVYEDTMLGACVIIDHGSGLEGYYCSLDKDIPVMEGQKVAAGTVIGMVGNTAEGEIKEPSHLHFALKKNGEWIDPIALISGEGS